MNAHAQAINRRHFLAATASATVAFMSHSTLAAESKKRRFTLDLSPGSIGVGGDQLEHLRLAQAHGFESVQPDGGFLARQDKDGIARIRENLAKAKLVWGSAGIGVDFRKTDEVFRQELAGLPKIAAALREAGVTRGGTWISPGGDVEYRANLERHAARLREIGGILRDHGIRFGLEYVGTPSLRKRFPHEFVHNLAQARELIAAIGVPTVGVVLDSWHWFTAGDSVEALLKLRNEDIVACDLNDAPAGVALADQQDNRRELPVATGVIPVKSFLQALVDIGYDGPVRAEPFNRPLNDLDDEAGCAKTIAAMKKAVALLG